MSVGNKTIKRKSTHDTTREDVLKKAQRNANRTQQPAAIYMEGGVWCYSPTPIASTAEITQVELVQPNASAKVTVVAHNILSGDQMLDQFDEVICETVEMSNDVPADALGEVAARVMQKAWRTGPDATDIELRITFH